MALKTKGEIVAETEAEFAVLQKGLETAGPGVAELLELYGQAEAAVRQADEYLAAAAPIVECVITSDSSSPL